MGKCDKGPKGRLFDARPARSLCAALIAAALVITGCAPAPPIKKELLPAGSGWDCIDLGDELPVFGEPGATWTQEGGDLISVHSTPPRDSRFPGRVARDEAVADAVTEAAEAALGLLEQRGVVYEPERRREIIEEAVRTATSKQESPFPRFRIAGSRWKECVHREGGMSASDAAADTAWSVSILVEYPIGHLRGDINNVVWERGRAVSEAEVLLASVEERLDEGRWMAALGERARVLGLIRGTGIVFPPDQLHRDEGAASGDALFEERLRLIGRTMDLTGAALATLSAGPIARVEAVEIGTRTDASASFRFTYKWSGRDVEAAGVPVLFTLRDAGAILRPEPVTDDAGLARCGIVAAYGEPGEYALGVAPDLSVVRAVDQSIGQLLEGRRPVGAAGEPGAHGAGWSASWAGVTVHLVAGTHATSVCVEFSGAPAADVAQVSAGFEKRMKADGFLVEGCGASVDVILTGRLAVASDGNDDIWTTRVTLTGSAFDQRTAVELGERTFTVSETSTEGRRAAEVLALKESGRLLAAYLGSRILRQGE
ncbi:MAG: hypothetical protein JXB46_06815 [Candidatus Eisenbacteria bacterium]|nr:hypothetical protein [Candidatus Eisenbacteria bacterium]